MRELPIDIKVKPFDTPNFVAMKIGGTILGEVSIPLTEVSGETLSELCKGYRAEIFKKAKKEDPMAVRIRQVN